MPLHPVCTLLRTLSATFAGACLFLPALRSALPDDPAKVHVVLLAGQSNMAGRATVEAEDRTADPRIQMLDENLQWMPAQEPMHFDKPKVAGVGPGLAFARELLKRLPADEAIALVPVAYGGTSINEWASDYRGSKTFYSGHTLYANAVMRARTAQSVGTLVAILWNQGESDAGMAAESYRGKLHALIADFRNDLGQPDLPFVAATLGPWRETSAQSVNSVYLTLADEVAHTAVVDTLDPAVKHLLVNKPEDRSHYDAPSARLLGRLYADRLAQTPGFLPSLVSGP